MKSDNGLSPLRQIRRDWLLEYLQPGRTWLVLDAFRFAEFKDDGFTGHAIEQAIDDLVRDNLAELQHSGGVIRLRLKKEGVHDSHELQLAST